jgi:hypothetical protein
MASSVLETSERKLLEALNALGVRFMLVGMSAALLQGARGATDDLDLWFEDAGDPRIAEAARAAGGFYAPSSFGLRPPVFGGDALGDRFDVVVHMHGLGSFADEWGNTQEMVVDGVPLRVLRLPRIIMSKRAAGRRKDEAQIPALEEALAAIEEADGGESG